MDSCWALLKMWPPHWCQPFLTRPKKGEKKERKEARRWHECWAGWPRTSARWNAIANITQGENTNINSIGWPKSPDVGPFTMTRLLQAVKPGSKKQIPTPAQALVVMGIFCTQLVAERGRQQDTVFPSKLYTSAEKGKGVQEKNSLTRLLLLTLSIKRLCKESEI